MDRFLVVTIPSFSDFTAEVVPDGTPVRLCLSERYAPKHFGNGVTIPAKEVTLELQGLNESDLVWLSESITVDWGPDGPATPVDQSRYQAMADLHDIVEQRLSALGYVVRPGRYALPRDYAPLNGAFDCAEWYTETDSDGHNNVVRVRPVTDCADDGCPTIRL